MTSVVSWVSCAFESFVECAKCQTSPKQETLDSNALMNSSQKDQKDLLRKYVGNMNQYLISHFLWPPSVKRKPTTGMLELVNGAPQNRELISTEQFHKDHIIISLLAFLLHFLFDLLCSPRGWWVIVASSHYEAKPAIIVSTCWVFIYSPGKIFE